MRRLFAGLVLTLLGSQAQAVTCEEGIYEDTAYTGCTVSVLQDDIRIFHRNADGQVYGSFTAIADDLGRPLSFGMNAGMYHDDRSAVGLLQIDGEVKRSVVTNAGPGNFGMLPNGVLCLSDSFIAVAETLASRDLREPCRDATQSGPMLLIDGELHPRFLEGGTSKLIRNGVGTNGDGTVAFFVISDDPVNFHTFARIFRDRFGANNALYLDGNISRLHAPQLGRSDGGLRLGPIVAVVE